MPVGDGGAERRRQRPPTGGGINRTVRSEEEAGSDGDSTRQWAIEETARNLRG
jgi:hypothetical protein